MVPVPREFHVTEVVLHKDFNFTRQVNDIALLKTSKILLARRLIPVWISPQSHNIYRSGEQVDLSAFPPVCLPSLGQNFAGLDGMVAGEVHVPPCTLFCLA